MVGNFGSERCHSILYSFDLTSLKRGVVIILSRNIKVRKKIMCVESTACVRCVRLSPS